MKKKIANGIELLFLIASYVIMLIPCVTMETGYSARKVVSAVDIVGNFPIRNTIMYVLFLLCAAMCVISILTKKKGHIDGLIHSILAIILFLYINYCLIFCWRAYGKTISNNFPTFIFEICLFAVIVVSFVKRSTLITGLPVVKIENDETSNADELKKYKELLDSGVITQEEFDAKKKQLLNL